MQISIVRTSSTIPEVYPVEFIHGTFFPIEYRKDDVSSHVQVLEDD